ncbi:MAG: hypothetical protein ACYCOU_25045, partial [Sulfobacillus sp.]
MMSFSTLSSLADQAPPAVSLAPQMEPNHYAYCVTDDNKNHRLSTPLAWFAGDPMTHTIHGIAFIGGSTLVLGAEAHVHLLSKMHRSCSLTGQDTIPAWDSAWDTRWHFQDLSAWRTFRSRIVVNGQRLVHSLMIPQDSIHPANQSLSNDSCALHWGPPDTASATWWALLQRQAVPLLPSWEAPLMGELLSKSGRHAYIQLCTTWSIPNVPGPILALFRHMDALPAVVTQALQDHRITIPSGI